LGFRGLQTRVLARVARAPVRSFRAGLRVLFKDLAVRVLVTCFKALVNVSSITSSRSLIQASRDGARLAAVVAIPAAKQTNRRRAAMVRV